MSVFADDWRACLRQHYIETVRKQDRVTLPSLTLVMYEVGFSDDDLAELRLLATMRADYVPPEVAEVRTFAAAAPDEIEAEAEPDAPDELAEAAEPEPEAEPEPDEDERDPDAPQQLSLF